MTGITPSNEQREILDLGIASIRIRAGAGTGKTTTVAMVIANLVADHGIDPEHVLGMTFTNKAAAELADRVRSQLGHQIDTSRQAEIHTYHGFAAQLLAEFGSLAGVDGRVRIITPTFSRQILTEIMHRTTYRHVNIVDFRSVDQVRRLSDRLADHLKTPATLLESEEPNGDIEEKRKEMLETLLRYEEAKRAYGVVDYGDLVTLSTRLMTKHPDFAARVRERYRAVILDEYQDTNPAQRVMLSAIFNNGFPIVAVGDEDQTIYEWRGATPENFEMFASHFGSTENPVHERGLTLNRRSAPEILDVANDIRRRANPQSAELVSAANDSSGEIVTRWASDALAEADWVASRFRGFHIQGAPWSEMAVLIRKNKDFPPFVEAMRRADIPIEVANVGGLLAVPEVAELRAWLTILERPADSASVLQVLFGSGYRLGLADIAPIAAWARSKTAASTVDLPAVSLLEAIERSPQIPGLRDDANAAISHFGSTYRQMLVESQGASLIETCRMILDATRAWQNAEALPDALRLTARLNLYRILDLAEDWSPLRGRPSLGAFLDYLDVMEDEPAEELDAARLSGEDAVTLVTVHRAKGLEWDIVSLPTLTRGNFPSSVTGGYPDPIKQSHQLPARHRIDYALDGLPEDEKARTAHFKHTNEVQEWRVAYVAATRARKRLLASGAFWYGRPEPNKKPKQPSDLFSLIAGSPAAIDDGREPLNERPDLLVRPPEPAAPDPLFPQGWASALKQAIKDGGLDGMAETMGVGPQVEERVNNLRQTLFSLDEYEIPEPDPGESTLSVTGLVTYARCPKRYYWTAVDPLPRRRNPAAAAGTELHRKIELHQRGQVPLEDVDPELYDLPGEAKGASGWSSFINSDFATRTATLVEAPFSYPLDTGHRLRGRIDAVYVDDDYWEIVDFKSGRPGTNEASLVQLQAYAVAAEDVSFGIPPPAATTVSFAYLGGGLHVDSFAADHKWIHEARSRLNTLAGRIDAGDYGEQPGEHCHNCDFLSFCEPGKKWATQQ